MDQRGRIPIPKTQGHGCFACGTDNPIGLKLDFYREGDWVLSEITLARHYEGWRNMAHGGIISALLDEVMSWAIMIHKQTLLVTRKMSLKFVRPVRTGVPLIARGRMVEDGPYPKVRSVADLRDKDGRLLVKGEAQFVLLSEQWLSLIPEQEKRAMEALFQRFREIF